MRINTYLPKDVANKKKLMRFNRYGLFGSRKHGWSSYRTSQPGYSGESGQLVFV